MILSCDPEGPVLNRLNKCVSCSWTHTNDRLAGQIKWIRLGVRQVKVSSPWGLVCLPTAQGMMLYVLFYPFSMQNEFRFRQVTQAWFL